MLDLSTAVTIESPFVPYSPDSCCIIPTTMVLDIAAVTAGSRQSLAISTLAKIRSRSWRLADLAISGYQPLTLAGLLALGGGLFPPWVTV